MTLSLYDNVKENTSTQRGEMAEYYFRDNFQFLTLSFAKELNPEFDIANFEKPITETDKEAIMDEINEGMTDARLYFLNDHDFMYQITDTKSGKVLSKNIDKINTSDDKKIISFMQNSSMMKMVIVVLKVILLTRLLEILR